MRIGSETPPSASTSPAGSPRPSPKMLGSMTAPTSTAERLKGDLSAHTPMMAQYQRVTFQAA